MNDVIQVKNLDFSYSKKQSLFENLNLQIPEKSIFCLVGPNGAGKTTLIKLLLGLLNPKSGEISVFGKKANENKLEILANTFATIEMANFYSHLSAAENLKVVCAYRNIDVSKIPYALEQAGLENNSKKFKSYSLGMKQRLYFAISYLYNPKLMFLDEPFNGLDPGGIRELRERIIKLNEEQGITFVISSHLLREVGSFCNKYAILHSGKILDQGDLSEGSSDLEQKYFSLFS